MSEGKLLLVEDDASLREALLDTLMLAHYDCVDVGSAEEAILTLKSQRFDMVISDVQMEGVGGIGLLNYLQQHHPKVP
ncbi:response regulator, partial [Psychrobacter sp. 1Y1]|uniref:response regulator n=1 Tax=Psychrobacter sp. 1Y1 TaxID=3453574 RepID=UPI003F48E856